jgi:hypothetical protein
MVGGLAFLAWGVAVASWVAGLRHLADDVSVGEMLGQGLKAFDASKYTLEGQAHYRRFKMAFAAFFAVCIVGGVVIAIAASTQ